MAPDQRSGRRHDQWAQLRFAVIGTLLAAPPKKGELHAALTALAARTWQHPIRGVPMRVARSTLERWYYHARHAPVDPVRALRRRLRRDAGQQPAIGEPLRHVLRAQYDAHRSWSYQLHVDNLRVLVEADAALGPLARDRRGRDRGRAAGRALCRRAGRLELYVRRGHRDATECRFHPESQPGDGGLSRRALFERFDRPALRALPAE